MILLLDLDDTLLGNRMDAFIPAYLQGLAKRLAPYAEPGKMIKSLLSAMRQMVENARPDCTLEQDFDAAFYPSLGIRRAEVEAVIQAFYVEDFPKLQPLTEFRPSAVKLVEEALGRGYRVGVATNPLFPRTAILQRLSWAGLPVESYPFALVPSYDTFHFAKPNPAYFAEFLAQMGWLEEPALMVGDDVDNDILPARQLGLPVFWIAAPDAVWSGPGDAPPRGGLDDVLPWIDRSQVLNFQPDYSNPHAMLAVMRSTPAALSYLCASRQAEELSRRPQPKEWSMGEVLCHLRDVEAEVNLPRLQMATRQDNPFLPGQDTDPWAEERQYICQDGLQALQTFTQTRMETLRLLDHIQAQDWQRVVRHAIFGPTQLSELVRIIAAHDRLHVAQIMRAR